MGEGGGAVFLSKLDDNITKWKGLNSLTVIQSFRTENIYSQRYHYYF